MPRSRNLRHGRRVVARFSIYPLLLAEDEALTKQNPEREPRLTAARFLNRDEGRLAVYPQVPW